jgi:hypothetical protein
LPERRDVLWVHPLADDLIEYRVNGTGHTLPTFWTLCERCEQLHRCRDDTSILALLKHSPGWLWQVEDGEEALAVPLAVFRRADLGAHRIGL